MNLLRKMEEMRQVLKMAADRTTSLTPIDKGLIHAFATMKTKVNIWEEKGCRTFQLSKSLIEAFQNTDIPLDMRPLDFQYPFDCFMIEGEFPLFQTEIKTREGSKTGTIFSILYIDAAAMHDVTFMDHTGRIVESLDWNRSLVAFFPGQGFGVEQMTTNMNDRDTLLESVTRPLENPAMQRCDEKDAHNLVNLFFNSLLYINDPDRRREDTERHESRKVRVSPDTQTKVTQKYIYLKPPSNYTPLSSDSGRTLDVRFVVRGHWRKQAYGEKHALHRLTWIKPYWKGPELGEIAQKVYKVS